MTETAQTERVLSGTGVTGGIAIAPVFTPPERRRAGREAGTPVEESAALRAAFTAAASALRQLAARVDDAAAAILEFQIELLDDDDLVGPVLRTVAGGASAQAAWSAAIDAEIADYAASGDAVLEARTADLEDLKERVSVQLSPNVPSQDGPGRRSIIVAPDLPPSRFLELDAAHVAGIALGGGSRTSHLALLARARGVPMLVGVGDVSPAHGGDEAVLDVEAGRLVLSPAPRTLDGARRRLEQEAAARERADAHLSRTVRTAAGERVQMLVNIDHPSMLEGLDPEHCDGIGLTRTEFLFQHGPPGEEAQLAIYAQLVEWARGRPVTIRTLDAGGDKPVPGLGLELERNAFLGVRGIRLSLARPDVFAVQLRALLRAAALGPVKIMLPMVTEPSELESAREMLRAAARELEREGTPHAIPPLGIMVEVPAAALAAEAFEADFYSIGSNDLIQYATAAARDNAAVAPLARGSHPGVLRLVDLTVAAAQARGRELSVCGDMASDPEDARRLVEAGVRLLSVAPATLGAMKAALDADPGHHP